MQRSAKNFGLNGMQDAGWKPQRMDALEEVFVRLVT